MAQQLLTLDARGVAHTRRVLALYLPGLDPGLTALSAQSALLPGTSFGALQRQYGRQDAEAVLRHAGVLRHEAAGRCRCAGCAAAARPGRACRRGRPRRPRHGCGIWTAWVPAQRGCTGAARWASPGARSRSARSTPATRRHPVFGFGASPWVDVAAGRTFFAASAGASNPGPGGGVDPVAALMDGHGTRVASVICGHDPAAPGGEFFGIAPRVPLVPVRIADHVLISHAQTQLAQALRHLVRDARVSVVNLSMGFLPRWQIGEVDRAIDEAYEAGVIMVCAAGQPLSSVISPAHGRRTIAAAGSTRAGVPWGDSAHGPAVDWAAPASEIFRADTSGAGVPGYAGNGDGTSYSAAITSGAAALWLARHGSALDAMYPQPWQRVEAFKVVAKASARLMPHQQPGSFGAGILQIDRLLQLPLPAAASLVRERPV